MNRFDDDLDPVKVAEYSKFEKEVWKKRKEISARTDLTDAEKAAAKRALREDLGKKFKECYPQYETKIIDGKVYRIPPKWRRDYFTTTTPLIISSADDEQNDKTK